MPLSTAAKAVLCLCPPAVMAGTVATVPAVRRAVHHVTAEHRPHKPLHRLASAAARPGAETAQVPGCDPAPVGPVLQPAVPLVTYAAPIPAEPSRGAIAGPGGGGIGGGSGVSAGVPVLGAVAPVSPIAATPAQSTVPVTGASAVPEPASWTMLIIGVGAVGTALRRRQSARRKTMQVATGATFWGAGAVAAEAGDVAATVAVKSAVASAAGKALLCVCPAAVVAGSVMAVPPLRHAVHASTAPVVARAAPAVRTPAPCGPSATVPVSAASISNFPAVVSTTVRAS